MSWETGVKHARLAERLRIAPTVPHTLKSTLLPTLQAPRSLEETHTNMTLTDLLEAAHAGGPQPQPLLLSIMCAC